MNLNKKIFPLDEFINQALYNPKDGYYMKNNPFGENGDFITSPNISILFSEMLSIWTISFWQYLKYLGLVGPLKGSWRKVFQVHAIQ